VPRRLGVVKTSAVGRGGQRCAEPVSLVDLYPTIIDFGHLPSERAGEDLPPLDGHSLAPLCRDPDGEWDGPDLALSTVPPRAEPDGDLAVATTQQHWTVRSQRYRYVRGNAGGEELYDLVEDPGERRNRAGDPELAAAQAELRAGLAVLAGLDLDLPHAESGEEVR